MASLLKFSFVPNWPRPFGPSAGSRLRNGFIAPLLVNCTRPFVPMTVTSASLAQVKPLAGLFSAPASLRGGPVIDRW